MRTLAVLLLLPALSHGAPGVERPLYYERALTQADLEGRTLRELSLMRNTIFARVGNHFRVPWLHDWFAAQPWYDPDKAQRAKLKPSKLDWANARLIGKREARLGKATLKKMAAATRERVAKKPTPEDAIELRLLSRRLGKWAGAGKPPPIGDPLEDPSQLERQLSLEELKKMSLRDLRILRNTVYARRGYSFKSEMLSMYFGSTDWYVPDPEYTPKKLNRLDYRNVKLIRSEEDSRGGPMTDRQQQEADGWFSGA